MISSNIDGYVFGDADKYNFILGSYFNGVDTPARLAKAGRRTSM